MATAPAVAKEKSVNPFATGVAAAMAESSTSIERRPVKHAPGLAYGSRTSPRRDSDTADPGTSSEPVKSPLLTVIGLALPALVVVLAACTGAAAKQTSSRSIGPAAWGELQGAVLKASRSPVSRHRIDGEFYYFLPGPCCDQSNALYDGQGNYVCDPNGGFAGQGDGRCPQLRQKFSRSKGEPVENPFYRP